MIDVVEIKKAIKDKELEFYIGGNRIYCRSDNGDTIQILDLSEHDKQIRTDAIEEFVEYVKQYMWWSTESDEKVIGEFALGEYAIAFSNKLKEQT